MITKKDYDKYSVEKKFESNKMSYLCWACKKSIATTEDFFCIQKGMRIVKRSVWIYFHSTCFIELAGTQYDFDNTTWKDSF